MLTGLAHTALRVADVDTAVAWYRDVLGLTLLSPPYTMEGDGITRDMGALVPAPVAVRAAIMGIEGDGDRVIEVIEYPSAVVSAPAPASVTRLGFTHVALVCDDVAATRRDYQAKGVRFLVDGIAEVAGLRTTWLADPWENVFILLEKVRRPDRPYFLQY